MRRTTLLGVTIAAALGSRAQAEDTTRDLTHGVHLALEAGLLGYGRAHAEREDDDLESDTGVLTLGYPASMSARAGYVALPWLELGGLFAFRYQAQAHDEGTTTDKLSATSSELDAYARYVTSGTNARMFGGARLGGAFTRDRDPGEDGQSDVESRGRLFVVGLDLGVYGFVAEHFSIDPALTFSYRTGSLMLDNEFFRRAVDLSSWDLTLTIALSGWLSPGR